MAKKYSQNNGNGKSMSLETALADIHKRFGAGAIMKMDEADMVKVESIPTGSLSLDLALGIGGIPRGRVTEIYGPESSGKTTTCLSIIANAQKMGDVCAFIDMEHAMDPLYAETCGVKVGDLLVSQPDNGEEALEIAETLVRSGAVGLVVIDSVAALVPRSELEGDMGQAQMGVHARLMSQALRKLTSAIHQTGTAVIFTNQLRQKIGVMFGNPETTTGGNALKFYASVRLDIRRISSIKVGTDVIGNRTRVRVVKNKVSPPFKSAEFDIMYNEGISFVGDLLDIATESNIIEKRGSFFSYNETRLGQGRENAKAFLMSNPELLAQIESEIRGAEINTSSKEIIEDDEDELMPIAE